MNYNFQLKQFVALHESPEKIAISASNENISWQQLKNKVEELSVVFQTLSIPANHPIIIYGHKESLFPIAMLACIHSGIAYIPVDTIYPVERIQHIISKTGAQIIINCSNSILDIKIPIVINNQLIVKTNFSIDYTGKIYPVEDDLLQYIIFTSGSTGEPKGVQITYKSLLSFINWAQQDFDIHSSDVIMSQALFSFDLSMWDFAVCLSAGATLVMISSELIKNQDVFINHIAKYKCTVWTSTPSFAFLFLRNPSFNSEKLPSLKRFYLMGEMLPSKTVISLKQLFGNNAKVFNAYGPTETTIITSLVEITEEILSKYTLLPIGYPMPGSELIIEKESSKNKEGELIISGNHVSIGYFKNEELNNRKFFIHEGKRAFKSGDIVYLENGLLFFIGRNDDQIKMHGFRIELDEISNTIRKNSFVADAVTVPLKRNNEVKKLVSFILVSSQEEPLFLKQQLSNFLSGLLPYYMVPSDIVIVNAFPFTSNHKIDKNKLISDYLQLYIG
jgi:D-alanine--poly(phosphoribitol) ligase subunit 1